MMHKAWSSIEEVPYCFSRSYVKLQGHTADCNYSLNSPMAMKCCAKLETAKERCPIVFQGHPSNFKVTRYKTSPILTQIGRFRTIGRSQLSNPSDLPCCKISALYKHIATIMLLVVHSEQEDLQQAILINWKAVSKCINILRSSMEASAHVLVCNQRQEMEPLMHISSQLTLGLTWGLPTSNRSMGDH